ncbi:MAG TPA: DUF2169 domain-containing protein [archaeon]|nr:DUF2169 domain-containing protein [archaeon]
METIKPDELSLLWRTFEREGKFFLAAGIGAGFTLSDPPQLVKEDEFLEAIKSELFQNEILDLGMPKPRGEVLVRGKCFAPEGKPRPASRVRIRVGSLDKTLNVFGDRFWKGPPGARTISQPLPFAVMDISYENAFGGPNYPANPRGKGHEPVQIESGGKAYPLPNVEDPERLITSPRDLPEPAGFGPLDLTWPQRAHKLGTFNDKWRRECWPYYPKDMDWTFFNAAPWNQQIDGFFSGEETLAIENMHPQLMLIDSRLPGLRVRCFIRKQGEAETDLKEVLAHLDTVWLFPGAKLGFVIYRGVETVADEEGADILLLLAAWDLLEETPKPVEYYRGFLSGEKTASAEEETSEAAGEGPAGEEPPGMSRPAGSLPPVMPVFSKTAPAQEATGGSGDELVRSEEKGSYAGKDLSGLDFSGKNLRGRDFSGAVMEKVNLSGTDLSEASFRGAILTGAVLDGAILVKADFSGSSASNASFAKANLEGADLSDSDFSGSDFTEAVLKGAVLKAALFAEAKMPGANGRETKAAEAYFTGADLSGANFSRAELVQADFSGALLEKTNFSRASLSNATFAEARGAGAVFNGADMQETRADGNTALSGADFSGASLAGASWQRADFSGSQFSGAILSGAGFLECNFRNSILSGVRAEKADLSKSDFTRADMTDINLLQGSLRKASLKQADLRGANLYGVDLYKAILSETALEGANLKNTLLSSWGA